MTESKGSSGSPLIPDYKAIKFGCNHHESSARTNHVGNESSTQGILASRIYCCFPITYNAQLDYSRRILDTGGLM